MSNLKPNPEYETARYEGVVLDDKKNKLSDTVASVLYGRPRPPRFKKVNDTFVEVPAFIPDK